MRPRFIRKTVNTIRVRQGTERTTPGYAVQHVNPWAVVPAPSSLNRSLIILAIFLQHIIILCCCYTFSVILWSHCEVLVKDLTSPAWCSPIFTVWGMEGLTSLTRSLSTFFVNILEGYIVYFSIHYSLYLQLHLEGGIQRLTITTWSVSIVRMCDVAYRIFLFIFFTSTVLRIENTTSFTLCFSIF